MGIDQSGDPHPAGAGARPVTPPGYVRRSSKSGEVLFLAAATDWLEQILDAGLTLYGWASNQPRRRTLSGRGTVYAVEAPVGGPDRRARWAVRHYHRGGAVASFLGDRYLAGGPTRPELEIRASAEARARTIPTPAVIAGAWYPAGLFYRADLVTELVPDATSLADALFATQRRPQRIPALAAAGRLARELGEKGLRHPDLNAMNILLSWDDETPKAYVIDLDRATMSEAPGVAPGRPMLHRLERSLRKLGASFGRPLSEVEWSALRAAFEEAV